MCGRIRERKIYFSVLPWREHIIFGIFLAHQQHILMSNISALTRWKQMPLIDNVAHSAKIENISQMKLTNCQTNNNNKYDEKWSFYKFFFIFFCFSLSPPPCAICNASHCSAQIFLILLHKDWLWIMFSFNDSSESHIFLLLCLYRSLPVAVVAVVNIVAVAIWMICKKHSMYTAF